jgi:hypothetical protein
MLVLVIYFVLQVGRPRRLFDSYDAIITFILHVKGGGRMHMAINEKIRS